MKNKLFFVSVVQKYKEISKGVWNGRDSDELHEVNSQITTEKDGYELRYYSVEIADTINKAEHDFCASMLRMNAINKELASLSGIRNTLEAKTSVDINFYMDSNAGESKLTYIKSMYLPQESDVENKEVYHAFLRIGMSENWSYGDGGIVTLNIPVKKASLRGYAAHLTSTVDDVDFVKSLFDDAV